MASSNTVEIGSLLAGGHHTLRVDELVKLEPFEGWSFPEPARVQLDVRAAHRMVEVAGTVDVVALRRLRSLLRRRQAADAHRGR